MCLCVHIHAHMRLCETCLILFLAYVYDDVTYVYDDVTDVYDDVTDVYCVRPA